MSMDFHLLLKNLEIDIDREACARYWPSGSLPEEYGDIEVEIINEKTTNFKGNTWIVLDLTLRKGVS
jgi:hypothetical protein